MRAAVAYGFGGNAGVGAGQAGFELATWKCEADGFGLWAVDQNRHLLPGDFDSQAVHPSEWTPARASLLIGTPPCAAFASVNFGARSRTHGLNSPWNSCMRSFIRYAASCTGEDGCVGPEVVAFESVPNTFSKGRPLIEELFAALLDLTGQPYEVTHLRVTNAVIGSAQLRKRYWFVASRIGTPAFAPAQTSFVTARDRIGDIESLDSRPGDPDHFFHSCGVSSCGIDRDAMWPYLQPGFTTREALKRYMAEHDEPPAGFERVWTRQQRGGFVGWPRRIDGDRPSPTLTGYCLKENGHYAERRHITAREGLRLMGMPDEWTLGATANKAQQVIGKAAPVESCRYVADAAARLIRGESNDGFLVGDPDLAGRRLLTVKELSA